MASSCAFCERFLGGARVDTALSSDGFFHASDPILNSLLEQRMAQETQLAIGRGVTGWVAKTGKPLRVPDVTADPRYVSVRKDLRSELAVPLLQQALAQRPDSPILHFRLGMAQFRAGNTADAKRNLDAAVKSGRKFLGEDEARATLHAISG